MHTVRNVLLAIALGSCCGGLSAEDQTPKKPAEPLHLEGARVETYKTVGEIRLNLYVFTPRGHAAGDQRPAIVFFFGGAWKHGTPKQFEQHCRYLADRGMVAITADYRVSSRHPVQVKDCVEDARSAIRWIRENAATLGIDPHKLAAGGGSAGGHLAACTAVIEGMDAPGEDLSVSAVPDALVLFNPAAALAPLGDEDPSASGVALNLSEQVLGTTAEALSPAHHVRGGLPPTIMFFGTDDILLAGAQAFQRKAMEAGSRCELKLYEGYGHGFFNFGRFQNKPFQETVAAMDAFLVSEGYLKGTGNIREWLGKP